MTVILLKSTTVSACYFNKNTLHYILVRVCTYCKYMTNVSSRTSYLCRVSQGVDGHSHNMTVDWVLALRHISIETSTVSRRYPICKRKLTTVYYKRGIDFKNGNCKIHKNRNAVGGDNWSLKLENSDTHLSKISIYQLRKSHTGKYLQVDMMNMQVIR